MEYKKKFGIMGVVLIALLIAGLVALQATPVLIADSLIGIGEKTFTIGHVAYAAGEIDYPCDGTDDDEQWQQALDALPAGGGKLVVLAADYSFSSNVTRAIDDVTIQGVGRSTYVALDGSSPVIVAGGDNWVFRDLSTDAGGIYTTGTTGWVKDNILEGSTYYALQTAGDILPNTTDLYNLGSSANRWNDIYITGTINKSPAFNFSDLSNGEYFCCYTAVSNMTAGENITAGEVVYMESDGDVNLGDASTNATMPVLWIALSTVESGNTALFMSSGYYRYTGWSETPGTEAYVDTTAGAITSIIPSGTGDQVQVIGYWVTSDVLKLDFDTTIVEIP